ncbi:hypothetical protein XELAEV_18009355mg [Xenopus laevis]|uniref:Uncharacterized protein n=1 Tax=Xenopus laevis TaxID=8355 RepID=A0A974DSJ6_XENLA|nr:hypothetical protein XELAEV_18009355mg [Xenopus laevis]
MSHKPNSLPSLACQKKKNRAESNAWSRFAEAESNLLAVLCLHIRSSPSHC